MIDIAHHCSKFAEFYAPYAQTQRV